MTTAPPSTRTVIERSIDETIARLSRTDPSPQSRAFLIEARRLKSVMATWRAIPPPADARREMLARVMHLAAAAGASLDSRMFEPEAPDAAPAKPAPRRRASNGA